VSVRITWLGFQGGLFYCALVAAFFASPYANLFFLLLGFLTLVGLSGVFAARRNLRGVTAVSPELAPVPTGEVVEATLDARAPRPARFGIRAGL
jgi:hypothetical protein